MYASIPSSTSRNPFWTTTLHLKWKLTINIIPYTTNIRILLEATLHGQINLLHAKFPSNTNKSTLPITIF